MEERILSRLEREVMEIVWEKKKCSVKDVQVAIGAYKKLAYTTVATILKRLYLKGLVLKDEEKSSYTYLPKVSKSSYSKNVASSFLKRFMLSFGDVGIVSFAESIEKLPKAKRVQLLKILEKYEKKR